MVTNVKRNRTAVYTLQTRSENSLKLHVNIKEAIVSAQLTDSPARSLMLPIYKTNLGKFTIEIFALIPGIWY